ncbi:MAG: GNAT family N-acetyltransferase [Anaerolineae bacterium]|nr:GNAT family N-acetyltransferase [Anaerolineae bacterium]
MSAWERTKDPQEIERYLRVYYYENIPLLADLPQMGREIGPYADTLSLIGYRRQGELVAVQGFYHYGRWLPHFVDSAALEPMLDDALRRRIRWLMGVRRIVDPFLERLWELGFSSDYDEEDHLCYVEPETLVPYPLPEVRRATPEDIPEIAELRFLFEREYFGTPEPFISKGWCHYVAEHYVQQGAYVVERDGRLVAMVAVEAELPELAHVGAVYTREGYRGRGFAKGVVTAICEELLARKPRVTLTVRVDNEIAYHVYQVLGFRRWTDYRMTRLHRF